MRVKRCIWMLSIGFFAVGVTNARGQFAEKGNNIPQLLSSCDVDFERQFQTRFYSNGVALYGSEYETSWLKDFSSISQNSAKQISIINDLLAKKNMRLIVLPIPSRSSILPAELMKSAGVDITAIDDSYRKFRADLKSNGAMTIDALTPLKTSQNQKESRVFLTEAHWTEDGASKIASVVAPYLIKGDLDIKFTIRGRIRPQGLSLIARNASAACNINLPEVKYKDYFFYNSETGYHYIEGFSAMEGEHIWALGKESKLIFYSAGGSGKVSLSFYNPIEKQLLSIKMNGKVVYRNDDLKAGEQTIDLQVDFTKGNNVISIQPEKTNQGKYVFAPKDARQMSLFFSKMTISNPDKNFMSSLKSDLSTNEAGLLDDSPIDTVLLGTSYSEESPGNNLKFADFLRFYSKSDVLNFSRGAGSLPSSIRDFIESPQFMDGKHHTLIWEFPYSEIMWRQTDLKQIISSLEFNSCPINEITEIKALDNVLSTKGIVGSFQVIFDDKSTRTMHLEGNGESADLSNVDRQESKNIFYFDDKILGNSQISIKSDNKSNFSVYYCRR